MNVYDGPRDNIGFPLLRGFPLTPAPVDPNVLAAYAGRYQSDGFDVTIRVDGTRIYIRLPTDQEFELIAISENQFYIGELYTEIAFYRNDRGEVDRVEAVVLGEAFGEAEKVP